MRAFGGQCFEWRGGSWNGGNPLGSPFSIRLRKEAMGIKHTHKPGSKDLVKLLKKIKTHKTDVNSLLLRGESAIIVPN